MKQLKIILVIVGVMVWFAFVAWIGSFMGSHWLPYYYGLTAPAPEPNELIDINQSK